MLNSHNNIHPDYDPDKAMKILFLLSVILASLSMLAFLNSAGETVAAYIVGLITGMIVVVLASN